MKGLEIIKKAFSLEEVDRVPWVPFVGCHGANITGVTAAEYLKSADLIFNGVSKSIEIYNPDGIPVVFDLQIEAEALGCQLAWSDDNPPAVISHMLSEGKSLSDLRIPTVHDGRIPVVIEATRKIRKAYPDIALYGLITGPYTLALHLLGTDIFLKMMEAPVEVHELLEFTKKVGLAMTKYYIDAGCDVIAVVDPMTSQIDPGSFEMFVHSPAKEIFDFIRSEEKLSSFFVCGHAQQNIEAMCATGPDNVSIDENIPLDFVRDIALKNKISFGGNLKLTVVLLMGTPDDARRDAMECIDLGGKKGFVLAPGCDLPGDTPIENIQAVSELVHDEYLQNVERAKEKSDIQLDLLNMKDYGRVNKVIVDIITLDSESCAPCQYMVEAVKRIAPYFEGIVEWHEHAIKKMEAVTFMSSLLVKNIPTICIDGKIAFVSKIPPQNELIAAIQKRINEKLKLIISSQKAEILILGISEQECQLAKDKVELAIKETGKEILVKTSTLQTDREKFGVLNTPSIVLTEHKIKAQGDVPSVDVIKEWLKEI
ncbi:MAG: thioredoxin family protein [Bacteroidales bacterium]|nr:thioredoxin family protein [Bacteroidales bacterium]MBN2820520.1 thioredoxin family protein [Bacteroidales bacterium]